MKDMKWFEEMEARIPHGEVRTRFAPSPTGYMHVGNLRTALYTYLIARHAGGKFILRIEDTDQGRLVEGAVDVIYKTMAECHLEHDEGPDVGGPVGPYVQTERRPLYKEYADLLIEKGHAYRCFCEKTESEEDSGDFDRADDPCRVMSREESDRRAAAGEPYVVRQLIPHEGTTTFHDEIFGDITVENKTLDDQVLIKRDGLPTYNFANVIDDHLMGITHVVRGSEYLSSAPKYNLLYQGFGWDIPKYVHCSPVMRDAHNKMSKRHGDPSYEDLIAQGFLTDAVLNYVTLLGWSPRGEQEIFSLDELKKVFELSGVSKSPAIFDIEKLRYFNSEYIRAMSARRWTSSTSCPNTVRSCSYTRNPSPTRRPRRRCLSRLSPFSSPSPTGTTRTSWPRWSALRSAWRPRTRRSCGRCASRLRARQSRRAARSRYAASSARTRL